MLFFQVYLWAGQFKFKVIARKDLEANLAQVRLSAREHGHGAATNGTAGSGLTTSVCLPFSGKHTNGSR
jgi:hypothetical protein